MNTRGAGGWRGLEGILYVPTFPEVVGLILGSGPYPSPGPWVLILTSVSLDFCPLLSGRAWLHGFLFLPPTSAHSLAGRCGFRITQLQK